MIGLTVSVDFGDLLAVTLPRNARHFRRVVVVTRARDAETMQVIAGVRNAEPFTTEAFTRGGAAFNKGLAIEEAIDALGRWSIGWLCSFDADVLMPDPLPIVLSEAGKWREDTLYAPHRRILPNPQLWHQYENPATWGGLERFAEGEFAGAFLLFNTHAPHLRDKRHWFGTAWRHAGGYDSQFWGEWPADKRRRMDWDVLHLGEHGRNWYGRATARLDGTVPEEAGERRQRMEAIPVNRRIHGYAMERLDGKRDWRAR